MRRSRAPSQLLNRKNKVVNGGAVRTVLPLAVVADAVDFFVEANGTANCGVDLDIFG